jgi:hypothetical protein
MLSRDECLKILELEPHASSYDIENRYTMLIKRYRGQTDDDAMARLDEITLAYNILTDRHIEPKPVDPRLEKVVFAKSLKQWETTWYYGRWPLLGITLALGMLIWLIVTIVGNTPPDFSVVAVGAFQESTEAKSLFQTSVISTVLPDAKKVDMQLIPLQYATSETSGDSLVNPIDSQSQTAFIMKMATLIGADTIDIFICDEPNFNRYAPQGSFQDLTGLYNRLQADLPAEYLAKVQPLRRQLVLELRPASATESTAANTTTEAITAATGETTSSDTFPGETTITQQELEAMNQDPSLPIYGLDVSALNLTEKLGLTGTSQILTVGSKSKKTDMAVQWIETLIKAGQP